MLGGLVVELWFLPESLDASICPVKIPYKHLQPKSTVWNVDIVM